MRAPALTAANNPDAAAHPWIERDPATGALTGMNEVMSPWAGGAAQ